MTQQHRDPSQRERLEYALVSGAACTIASSPGTAIDIARAIKSVLDELHPQLHGGSVELQRSIADLARTGMDVLTVSHASDCAVHNEPAMPAGPCNCATRVPGAAVPQAKVMAAADALIEAEIQAKGKTAPRVTPDDIQREIVGEHYFTAEQGARHPDAQNPLDFGNIPENLGLLTFCVLVLKNGFKVVGINYGDIDPAQHDVARGRQEARAQAVEKVWELLNFRLRDKLAGINDSSKAEQVLGEVLSVVQHYLPSDGGTAHDAMGKIIGLVDPWPLHARPLPCGAKTRTAQSPIDMAAEEYARAEQNLSISKLHSREAQDAVTAAFEAERAADAACKAALGKLAEAALPKHPDATQG